MLSFKLKLKKYYVNCQILQRLCSSTTKYEPVDKNTNRMLTRTEAERMMTAIEAKCNVKTESRFCRVLQKNYHKSSGIVFLSRGCICIDLMERNWCNWESYLTHWGHLISSGYIPEISSIRRTKTKNGLTGYHWNFFFLFSKRNPSGEVNS